MADTFRAGAHRVRAKIYVREVSQLFRGRYRDLLPETERDPDGPANQYGLETDHFAERVEFAFVNGNDPDSENAKFWSASPEAQPFGMTIANPGAQGIFKAGQEFYLDFVESIRTAGD